MYILYCLAQTFFLFYTILSFKPYVVQTKTLVRASTRLVSTLVIRLNKNVSVQLVINKLKTERVV